MLELECMDFYENQDDYMSLVEEKDYTLHFDVNEERPRSSYWTKYLKMQVA